MTDHYDALETRDPAQREAELFARLPTCCASDGSARLRRALAGRRSRCRHQPGRARRPAGVAQIGAPCPAQGRPAFRRLGRQVRRDSFARLFTSPGPIFEPEATNTDPWRGARALFAAGFRPGDLVLNTFSYHLTPGGFIFDSSARALGCAVIPAGPGNAETQFELIEAYRPVGYSGTPDFLKMLLDAAASAGRDVSSIRRAVVSGAAFPKSLQDEMVSRGIAAYQAFGTADFGISYRPGGRLGTT